MSRKKDPDKKQQAASMRLDKLLAQEGLGTRSELGRAIRRGRACVNGTVVKDPGMRVSAQDEVLFDEKAVRQKEYVYYMLHKPAGVISATEDSRVRTVLDLLHNPVDNPVDAGNAGNAGEKRRPVLRRGLFPVGRLDKDTEGLLLITDDGQLAHRLLAPGKHVDKTYYAVVTGQVTDEDIEAFGQGIELDDSLTAMPAKLQTKAEMDDHIAALIPADVRGILPDGADDYSQTTVTIKEGKFHQIKRMFAARGKEVLYLKRLSMGPLSLDPTLAPGQFRPLTQEEINTLMAVGSAGGQE